MRVVILFLTTLLYTNALAYTCYSSHCEDIRIGLGAHHSKTYDTGVYLSAYAAGHWDKLYIAGGVNIGQMYPTFAPTIDSNKQDYNTLLASAYAHIGTKLGGENPLFLYIETKVERYSIGENNIFSANQLFMGAYIANHTKISSGIALEIGLGISPSITRYYTSQNTDKGFISQRSNTDGSYRIDTFIGMRFKRGNEYIKKSDKYERINGILYHNKIYDTPITLPPHNDYAFMFECGISLESLLNY